MSTSLLMRTITVRAYRLLPLPEKESFLCFRNFASLVYRPTETSPEPNSNEQKVRKLSEISFDNGQVAFSSVPSRHLIKHGLILSILRLRGISGNAAELFRLSHRLLGKKITTAIIRATFFSHFCGGEDLIGLMKTSQRLSNLSIGSIVDYAAESDDTSSSDPTDAWLDKNVEITKHSIVSAACVRLPSTRTVYESHAYTALKVTALAAPALLRKITNVLNLVHSIYGVGIGIYEEPSVCIPYDHVIMMTKSINFEQFSKAMQTCWPSILRGQLELMFNTALQLPGSISSQGLSYFQFHQFLSLDVLLTLKSPHLLKKTKKFNPLDDWLTSLDVAAAKRVHQRLDEISEFAKDRCQDVRLLVDAEQTFYQTAIDYFVLAQQEKWNKIENNNILETSATIYSTYQLYLKNALGRLKCDAKRADVMGYKFATKLVRGAYIFQESQVAFKENVASPINPSLATTHFMYDEGVKFMIGRVESSEVFCGTHNEDSTKKAAAEVAKLGVNPSALSISFGQLLGMCDHISLTLAKAGCRIFKYVPYGPVDLVIPYLIRRAEENSGVLSSSSRESRLIWNELKRRAYHRCKLWQ